MRWILAIATLVLAAACGQTTSQQSARPVVIDKDLPCELNYVLGRAKVSLDNVLEAHAVLPKVTGIEYQAQPDTFWPARFEYPGVQVDVRQPVTVDLKDDEMPAWYVKQSKENTWYNPGPDYAKTYPPHYNLSRFVIYCPHDPPAVRYTHGLIGEYERAVDSLPDWVIQSCPRLSEGGMLTPKPNAWALKQGSESDCTASNPEFTRPLVCNPDVALAYLGLSRENLKEAREETRWEGMYSKRKSKVVPGQINLELKNPHDRKGWQIQIIALPETIRDILPVGRTDIPGIAPYPRLTIVYEEGVDCNLMPEEGQTVQYSFGEYHNP